MHDELHPSPLILLLSSHSSVGCFNPSPQFTVHSLFALFGDFPSEHSRQSSFKEVVPLAQTQLSSIVHVELQPSLLAVLSSSHCSLECFSPSPQVISHPFLLEFGKVPPGHR